MPNRYFSTPPARQGQIVEVSYCQVGDVLLRRRVDRSDRSETYASCDLEADEIDAIEPWNSEPTPSGDWTQITAEQAQAILEEGP